MPLAASDCCCGLRVCCFGIAGWPGLPGSGPGVARGMQQCRSPVFPGLPRGRCPTGSGNLSTIQILLSVTDPVLPPGGPGSVFALCCQKVIDDFLKFRENLLTDLNRSVKRIRDPSQGAKVIVNLQRF